MTDEERVRAALSELVAGEPTTSPPIEDAFAPDGRLHDPLLISTTFDPSVVQWALARHGLRSETTGGGSVTVIVDQRADANTDLARLVRAGRALERFGVFFGGPLAYTSTDGWDRAHELAGEGTSDVAFWNHQSHAEAFDARGDLIGDLHLQWIGNAERIAAALRDEELDVDVPSSAKKTIIVRHRGAPSSEAVAVAAHTRLADELIRRGWAEAGRAERWFSWPGTNPTVRLTLGEETTIALEVSDNDRTVEVEIDYGSKLLEVIAAVDAARDSLTPDRIPGALDPIMAVATSISYLGPSGNWQELH